MIQSLQLQTPKGSLTNARTVTTDAYEALFSYETLVGVKVGRDFYVQRSGAASSRTTGKHIGLWLKTWGRTVKDAKLLADESALQALVR